jgi:hypothetical protein
MFSHRRGASSGHGSECRRAGPSASGLLEYDLPDDDDMPIRSTSVSMKGDLRCTDEQF